MIPCTIEKSITHPTGKFELRYTIDLPIEPWVGMLIYGLRSQYLPIEIAEIHGYDCFANCLILRTLDEDTTDPTNSFHNWSLENLKLEFESWGWEKLHAVSVVRRD